MLDITFHPIALTDCNRVREKVYHTECRNCDLNFMNLMSWRSLYSTEIAYYREWVIFRFRFNGRLAYLPPIGEGDCSSILHDLKCDALKNGEPLLLMGVCEHYLDEMTEFLPENFSADYDRAYSDYIYKREDLANLSGKKLQSKRNHVHKFERLYPNSVYSALSESDFDECRALVRQWHDRKGDTTSTPLTYADELNALNFAFEHWAELGGLGGVLRVDNRLVAFTYGAPINYDTFDICVEKADVNYEGAFTKINKEFASHLPEKFVYVNREEDLGIEGLRQAKMSYHPESLIHKYILSFE